MFDAVTISFGLRNVVDHSAALREMARVTRPGGRLVVCEFSTPTNRLFATVYKEYLMQALPRIASAVSSNPDAYVYLAESIRAWPDQAELAHRIADAGWSAVRWRNLTGGIVALHAATKPTALNRRTRESMYRHAMVYGVSQIPIAHSAPILGRIREWSRRWRSSGWMCRCRRRR